jgi:hypothetical protein
LLKLPHNHIFMKKTLNIFLILLSSLAIGYWGELVELSTSEFLPISTKINDNTEGEVETEFGSYFEAQEKLIKKGAGGESLKNKNTIVFTTQTVENPSNSLANTAYFEAFNSIKAYNNRLFNSIATPKLYILFHCSKTFLS